MNLSAPQIAQYAAAAGFPDVATATAIALAESSGDPNAVNPEGSYGLWQIYVPAHPEYAGANLFDPQTNANAAFDIYSASGGFTPWTTYKTGAYLKYLGTAQASLTPSIPTPTSIFAPSTSVMTLFPTAPATNLAPQVDYSSIALALALAVGVLFAFSEG
jgi:hypothetical protein